MTPRNALPGARRASDGPVTRASAPPDAPTVLDRLRQETRPQHEAMEAVFTLPQTRDEHRRWTAVFYGFLEPLERAIVARLGPAHPLVDGRRKAPWLAADLQALGGGEAGPALPRCAELPRLDPFVRLLGVQYVFEGATMGGRVISRHLEERLGFTAGVGYSYFRGYGGETAPRWQAFRAFVLQHSGPAADDEIVAGAAETFDRLRRWCVAQLS